MRIALITPEYPGCGPSYGIGSYVQRLGQELDGAGHAVCVAVVAQGGTWLGHPDHVYAVSPLRIPGIIRPWWATGWLQRTLDDLAPDVVELPNWGGLGAYLPRAWPLVVRLSTSITHQPARDRLRAHLQHGHLRLECASVRRAHLVIANSRAIADDSAPLYRRMADRIVPHAHPRPRTLGQPTGTDVLFVGRREHRKGVDILLRAWPGFRRRFPDRTLHLVGAGHEGLVGRLSPALRDGITVHGVLSDAALTSLRERCQIQVVPSRFESFGLTVVEAFAGGQVVIAADCAGLSETVGPAGVTYAVEDHHALTAALTKVGNDAELRTRLITLGAERLSSRYSLPAWREATLAAYQAARERARVRPSQAGAVVKS
jgi:glycosyltransferase involved in cell wall biosynthesis